MKSLMILAALAASLAVGCAVRDAGRGGGFDTGEEMIHGTRTNVLGHGPVLEPGTRLSPGLRSSPNPADPPSQSPGDSDSGLFLPRDKHRSFQI